MWQGEAGKSGWRGVGRVCVGGLGEGGRVEGGRGVRLGRTGEEGDGGENPRRPGDPLGYLLVAPPRDPQPLPPRPGGSKLVECGKEQERKR